MSDQPNYNAGQTMAQDAPYPFILRDLVDRLKYKPGWSFVLAHINRDHDNYGLTLIITTQTNNSEFADDASKLLNVSHYFIVPAATYDLRSWRRWIFDQLLLVEQHEAMEFFRIDGLRPYAPAHQPGSNPYLLFEAGVPEDRTTDFKGQTVSEI